MQRHSGRAAGLAGLLALLCCLQLVSLGSGDEQVASDATNTSLAQPDYSIYLRKNELLKRVRQVVTANPEIMKYETRHAADGDYKIDMMVVTVEPAGLNPTHKLKARLLLDFGEHGREYITSEVGLRLLEVLADPDKLSKLVGGGRRAARLKATLQHTVFKILPMENTAGRDLVESGKLCERKNGRGVDTNRNWDVDWGKKEKDYDPNEEFPGKAPLSEPEVQILLGLAKELKPHVWLNVHSGMYALFTPYDHKGHVPNTTDARAALRLLGRIKETVCPQCAIGSGGHTVGYLAHGTATDYMFEVLKVPMAFTWEIYGDEKASFEDCFRMFNPLGKEQFEEVVNLWTKALLQLVELLPTHPATWPIFKRKGLDRWETVMASPEPAAAGAASANATSSEEAKQAVPALDSQPPPQHLQQPRPEEADQQQPQKTQGQAAGTPPDITGATAGGAAADTAAGDAAGKGSGTPVDSKPSDTQQQPQQQPTEQHIQEQQQQPQQQEPKGQQPAVGQISNLPQDDVIQQKGDGEAAAWGIIRSNGMLPLVAGLLGLGGTHMGYFPNYSVPPAIWQIAL